MSTQSALYKKWVCTQTCPQQSNNDKKEVSSIVSLNESLKTDKRARLNRAQSKNLPLISEFSETSNRSSAVPVVYLKSFNQVSELISAHKQN